MYTESIEKERSFVAKLLTARDWKIKNGDKSNICKCPKCKNGNVVCKAVYGPMIESSNGQIYHKYYQWDEYCELCGEKFDINRIKSDIFFMRPFATADELKTPLGVIRLYKNDTQITFNYRTDKKVNVWDKKYEKIQYSIPAICVELDFNNTEVGDTLSLQVGELSMMGFCSDENSLTDYYEDDNYVLGVSMFDTFTDNVDWCCYQNMYTPCGISYKVICSPKSFSDIDFYRSTHVEIAIALIDKSKYSNYKDILRDLDMLI